MFEIEVMRCIGGRISVLYSQVSVCFKERPTFFDWFWWKAWEVRKISSLWNLVNLKNRSGFKGCACQMPFATISGFTTLSSHFTAVFSHLYCIKDSLGWWNTRTPWTARERKQAVNLIKPAMLLRVWSKQTGKMFPLIASSSSTLRK